MAVEIKKKIRGISAGFSWPEQEKQLSNEIDVN